MKKIIVGACFLLMLPIISFAFEDVNVLIQSVKVEQPEYKVGDIIRGEIQIFNNSNIRQSDLNITTSIQMGVDSNVLTFDTQTQDSKVYAEANSKRTITFEHVLSKDVAGEIELLARIISSDGRLISEGSIPVTIFGVPERRTLVLPSASVSYNGESFDLQVGPTIKQNSKLLLNIKTGIIGDSSSVTPVLTIYNRSYQSEPIKEIRLENITLKDETEYEFEIPTDLGPLVYAGALSFESSKFNIPPVYFRYIIEGSIGTILNANTNVLNGKAGDTIEVKISYAGTPPVINESVDLSNTEATIEVEVFNEKNELIGEGQTTISLGELGDVIIPVTLSQNANNFKVAAIMKEGENVLFEYKTELPSEEQLQSEYKTDQTKKTLILYTIIILLLLTVVAFFFLKKKWVTKIPTIALIGLTILGGLGVYVYKSSAAVIYAPYANQSNHLNVSIFVKQSYAPGEIFTPGFGAYFPACSNSSFNHQIYGPSDNWATFDVNLAEINSLFEGYQTQWGDYALNTKLPILINWWKSKGGELVYDTNSQTDADYVLDIGNQESYGFYLAYSNKTYTAPTEPGIYSFHVMIANFAGANMAAPRIENENICVTGGGFCVGEDDICPNLSGIYTQDSDGIIYKNGTATKYIKNADGNCVNPPAIQQCDNTHVYGQDVCVDGQIVSWSCFNGAWVTISKNKTCAGGIWCRSATSPVVSGALFFMDKRPYPENTEIINWRFPDDTSKTNTNPVSYKHDPLGVFNAYVDSTIDGVTKTATCPFEIICGPKPDDNKETACVNGFKKMYICTQESGLELQTVACAPINGQCGVTNNLCVSTGTFTDTPDSPSQFLWTCNGQDGGTNASCTANKTYNVEFRSNGGAGTMASQVVASGQAQNLSKNTFTRSGYVFAGWATVSGAGGAVIFKDQALLTMGTSNVILHASWVKQNIIVFDANTGSGTMDTQTFLIGERKNLIRNEYTKEGYSFVGWGTTRGGTAILYQDQDLYTMTSSISVRLYAKWVVGSQPQTNATLTVAKRGTGSGIVNGTGGINCGPSSGCSKTFPVGTSITLSANPSNQNTFTRWYSTMCSSTNSTCTFTISRNETVDAEFTSDTGGDGTTGELGIGELKFDPNIANTAQKCSLKFNAENVKSCSLFNRLNQSTALGPVVLNKINILNQEFSIGTYRLECTKLDDTTYNHTATISCSSNPNIDEF